MAPDAFKGTATAADIAAAMAAGAASVGFVSDECPLSDGGEGFLDVLAVLGGDLISTAVTGPSGVPVVARWRLVGDLAVVESAQASGLVLAGGAKGNDPISATTKGTGELIAAAVSAGAKTVLVGVGGSATTDGGEGALEAIDEAGGIGDAEVLVACDVEVGFLDAARIFGPQKGADPDQVAFLSGRLRDQADRYRRRGVEVTTVSGSGAAGGLGGGLVVAGAKLVPGLDLVATHVGLDERIEVADVVVTGEGRLDRTSWTGKVVAGVTKRAARAGKPVFVVAGQVASDAMDFERGGSDDAQSEKALHTIEGVVDMSLRFGTEASMKEPARCAELATASVLVARAGS